MEKALTKDEILNIYVNTINFGHARYGVEEAAQFYFGKHAKELSLGEAASLAGTVQLPERINPVTNAVKAKKRQQYVLGQLARPPRKAAVTRVYGPFWFHLQALMNEANDLQPEIIWIVPRHCVNPSSPLYGMEVGCNPVTLQHCNTHISMLNSRSVFEVSSGSVSLINAPAPASLPARYFSFFAVR